VDKRVQRILVAVALGAIVASVNAFADMELDRLGVRPAATFLNDFAVGLVAGWCAYAWASLLEERSSRAVSEEKLRHETLEMERTRIAREVHDTLAQGFAGMIINLEAQQEFLGASPEARTLCERALKIGKQSLADARNLLRGLRPAVPDARNFQRAVEEMMETLTGGSQLQAKCLVDTSANEVSADLQAELLPIIREAVHNVVKHADAREVRVTLHANDGQIQICVEDDGRGFDTSQNSDGFGLTGMSERARNAGGRWWVYSEPNRGTQVVAVIPIPMR
jgi:signal transduction histidine kinase